MKHLKGLLAIATAAMLILAAASCSKKESFTIRGTIADAGAQSIVATYFADGGLQRMTTPLNDGKFSMAGASKQPTLLTLSMSDGTLLATMVVSNGDKIKLETLMSDPSQLSLSGNSESADIAEWTAANAALLEGTDDAAVNRAVAEFVKDNKSSMAATAILVSYFRTQDHELQADSLFTLIEPDARPAAVVQSFNAVLATQLSMMNEADLQPMLFFEARDSVMTFYPRRYNTSLLAVMPESPHARDSVTKALRRLTNTHSQIVFQAVEIFTQPDSASWKLAIKADTAVKWFRTWAPGSLAAPSIKNLGVPTLPYFIVADSVGAQLCRTTSITRAEEVVNKRLERFKKDKDNDN